MFQSAIIFLCLFLLLTACNSMPATTRVSENRAVISHSHTASNSPYQQARQEKSEQAQVRSRLLDQLNRWYATPYRMGGLSRHGIDCSGFVHLTFRQQFEFTIPRTTQSLSSTGKWIPQSKLQTGDLIFFKSRTKTAHVGIYVGQGDFIHASTSRGVMRSSLTNPYWRQHYWQSRRLANLQQLLK